MQKLSINIEWKSKEEVVLDIWLMLENERISEARVIVHVTISNMPVSMVS